MASTLISNPITSSTRESRKKKKKRSQITQNQSQNPNNTQISWKSDTQQQLYSSKLLQALRQVRLDDSTAASAPRRGKAVREAADRVLAATAKGKSRWSRAILSNRLKMKFSKNLRRPKVTVPGNGASKSVRKAKVSVLRLKSKNLPAVQRKARFLGRLVPGCRKESLPVVLEEAGDYIAALEMQVRAMAALAELLSGGSSSGAGSR
ncbi:transcription factor bHLH148-like isoform X2 [Apium graveolens]|uniref:transcription factor bHLH148-like isoform X2 n=1 Tax=Apium graveolens TaxID=4045 RepID=UPI003D7B8668